MVSVSEAEVLSAIEAGAHTAREIAESIGLRSGRILGSRLHDMAKSGTIICPEPGRYLARNGTRNLTDVLGALNLVVDWYEDRGEPDIVRLVELLKNDARTLSRANGGEG